MTTNPQSSLSPFRFPWAVEGKPTPFHPWVVISVTRTLDTACDRMHFARQPRGGGYAQTRVRAR